LYSALNSNIPGISLTIEGFHSMGRRKFFNWTGASAAALLLIAAAAGCAQRQDASIVANQFEVASVENLDVTIDYLFGDEQYALTELEEKVSGGLNRWLAAEKSTFDGFAWHADPLTESLPAELKPLLDDLPADTFRTQDAHYLQGQIWMKTLAESIVNRPAFRHAWPPLSREIDEALAQSSSGDALATALKVAHAELDDEQAGQLASAFKLFDWTVRNVLLLPRAAWPSEQGVSANYLVESEDPWPPSRGVIGPGYQRLNWQTLIYGRGDDIERARIFVQLARQREIDAVILAFSRTSESAAPNDSLTIWLPAVALGDQLYLFDTRLGLPIPGPAGGRIATLADVKQNPQLLKGLDLTADESTSDDSKYWLGPEFVSSPVVALVDAPLESLSKRMAILERNLTGTKRIICTSQPTRLAERLKGNPLIQETRLLPAEFSARQFRQAVKTGLDQSRFSADIRERLGWHYSEEDYVDSYVRLRTAKNKYFWHKFESQRGVKVKGALEQFSTMVVVYTDDFINKLESNTNVLQALGLQAQGMSTLEYQQRLAAIKSYMRLVRGDATYFLALCHLEGGNPSTANTWLGRVGVLDERGQWKLGVPYLSSRAHEQLGEFADAIGQLQVGRNDAKLQPQTLGNLLRVRLIKQYLAPDVESSAVSADGRKVKR
jgi:hypothetical protein